jgi:HSP20 family protein
MLSPLRGGFWDPQSEFDRRFNDMVGDLFGWRRAEETATRTWAPRLAAYAKDGDLVLHAELPGVSLEDVDITLDANLLTISKGPTTSLKTLWYRCALPHPRRNRQLW